MTDGDPDAAARFLSDPATHGGAAVETMETHGARVFLAGNLAYKIKRPVRFSYMDFSTLEHRRAALTRELAINRDAAPDLYLDVIPITTTENTSAGDTHAPLALAGSGTIVEWVLRMRRFPADALLSHVARDKGISTALAVKLADAVAESHGRAERARTGPQRQSARLQGTIAQISDGLAGASRQRAPDQPVAYMLAQCSERLSALDALLELRAHEGFVRRCHGDLHLANVVLLGGRPTLFDALEFDEDLATIDTLYDLAFLLMDLLHYGQRTAACVLLNRYLWRSKSLRDVEGLATLPLFLALRAGIRAMVAAQRDEQKKSRQEQTPNPDCAAYLAEASRYLTPPPPRLVAVGGVSGTGKSTLAAALAPLMGAAPGALHLRSDLERKALLDVDELERLPATAYTREVTRAVYARLLTRAEAALRAGQAVVLDAAHLQDGEKAEAGELAQQLALPFHGIWLTAPADTLRRRVAQRTGDASDATVAVLDNQLGLRPNGGGWIEIDAGGHAADAAAAACSALGLHKP